IPSAAGYWHCASLSVPSTWGLIALIK
ncbi:hypothetical protein MGSAQ_002542, partial [marine sediment metagenome]